MSSSVKNAWNTMFITAVCVIFLKIRGLCETINLYLVNGGRQSPSIDYVYTYLELLTTREKLHMRLDELDYKTSEL